jgi:hypothetical protein
MLHAMPKIALYGLRLRVAGFGLLVGHNAILVFRLVIDAEPAELLAQALKAKTEDIRAAVKAAAPEEENL